MPVLTDSAAVAGFCSRLRHETYVTVDTEFVSERTYWPQLCLLQIAGGAEAAIVDTLAGEIDLQPVFDLMADPSVLKVFHAGRQDLEILLKLAGDLPRPVFDTQIAAMACGLGEQAGYARIVEEITGAVVDKGARFIDWSRRPLDERALAYALADVTHLRDVYDHLRETLERSGRYPWIEERMAVLSDCGTFRADAGDAWKRIRRKPAKPRDLAVLREVAAWRERLARKRNVPRKRIVQDEALVAIAMQRPASTEALAKIRLVPRGVTKGSWGGDIVACVARAMALEKSELPRPDAAGEKAERLPEPLGDLVRALINARCRELGIAPGLIASADEIRRFAGDSADAGPLASGWRYELLGRDIEGLRAGRLALLVENGALKLLPV